MENGITRRGFLGLLTTAAAATTAAIVVPERRFWQVGATIAQPSFGEVMNFGGGQAFANLLPIDGQPGLWRDTRTGQVINFTPRGLFDRELGYLETSIALAGR
jgi:hypothetical protein